MDAQYIKAQYMHRKCPDERRRLKYITALYNKWYNNRDEIVLH